MLTYRADIEFPDEALKRLEAEYGGPITADDLPGWIAEAIKASPEARTSGDVTVTVVRTYHSDALGAVTIPEDDR